MDQTRLRVFLRLNEPFATPVFDDQQSLCGMIVNGFSANEARLVGISQFEELIEIAIIDSKVSAVTLSAISQLPNLQVLSLADSPIGNRDIQPITDSSSLLKFILSGTLVTPKGCAEIRLALPKCEVIVMDDETISSEVERLLADPHVQSRAIEHIQRFWEKHNEDEES